MTRREFARMVAVLVAASEANILLAAAEPPDAMRRYINRVRRDLRRFQAQQCDATQAAGARLAERVASGGRLLIFDQHGAYSSEALGRAGGLMAITPVRDGSEASVRPGDALLIISDEPAAEADLAVARPARDRGALVVGICPKGDGTGTLAEACDIALDNYVRDGDGVVAIPGRPERVGPTSGVMNTAILWALTAAYIEAMEGLGKPPHVWMSIKRPGAGDFNAKAREAAREVGY